MRGVASIVLFVVAGVLFPLAIIANWARNKLTGGSPEKFCPALPVAVRAITAWAEAVLGDEPAEVGVTDFAYAPVLQRDVGAYVDAAPNEVAQRANPILARARDGVAALRALGLKDADIKRLADLGGERLGAEDSPDGVTVRADLVKVLEERVAPERLRESAVVFSSGQSDPASLLDLGFVPTDVAHAAGLDCVPVLATI
jgi:hypothetical protein